MTNDISGPYILQMEVRIAKLEAHVEHIQADVTELKSDVKTIKDQITDILVRLSVIENTMATKSFVVTALLAMLAAIAALIGFTDQIQAFFGN